MAEPLQPDAAAPAAASPRRPRPGLAPFHPACPSTISDSIWFGAGRLGRGDGPLGGPYRLDEASIARAWSRSDHAEALAAKARKVADDAALLRRDAAEGKRLAGVPAEAFEDYSSLARHYLATGAPKSGIAYMRKALQVSDMAGDAETAVAGRLLAAETYVAVRQRDSALKQAKEARDLAEEARLVEGIAAANKLIDAAGHTPPLGEERCICRRPAKYLECCGTADTVPAEFSPEGLRASGIAAPGLSRQGGWRAIETLMRPEQGTELLTWYAWHVEDGCHRLVAYPNWSARSLRTAERMARIARDEDSAEAAAEAVLASFVALESFLISWKSLLRLDRKRQAPVSPALKPDEKRNRSIKKGVLPKLVDDWTDASREMFGAECAVPDEPGFATLAELRNELVHHASVRETVIPAPAQPDHLVAFLKEAGCGIRPAPLPWIDRIMTPDVADWAIRCAKVQIAAVRAWWDAFDHADTNREWWLSIAGDTEDPSGENDAFEGTDEPPAPPWPDEAERTGLRLIGRGRPED